MSSFPEPSNKGNPPILGREIHKHLLLNHASSKDFRAFAYPASEAEGIHFWSLLLPRLGLEYLCSPRKPSSPGRVLGRGLKVDRREPASSPQRTSHGRIRPIAVRQGIILGVEYESKASHAKKHFLADGATKYISLICCNRKRLEERARCGLVLTGLSRRFSVHGPRCPPISRAGHRSTAATTMHCLRISNRMHNASSCLLFFPLNRGQFRRGNGNCMQARLNILQTLSRF